ncbi:MAG: sensor histidine kinase [Candidatus Krumholzibacteriia bacterium]
MAAEPSGDRRDLIAASFSQSLRPLLVLGGDGVVAAASAGAGWLLGREADALAGMRLEDLVVPADVLSSCRADAPCGASGLLQVQMRTAPGDLVPVEIRCSRFEQGGGRHCLLFLTDLRQRGHEDEVRAVRLAKLSLLNQVSEALYGADLSLEQILQAVLICVTAGEGLRFNRAFLLLIDEAAETLKGELAIGPGDREEAWRIWSDLAGERADLFEMMTTYDSSVKQTDTAVNAIVARMSVPLAAADHLLVRTMDTRQAVRAGRATPGPGVDEVLRWLGCTEFAVAPLTTRRGPLGVIIADNAFSRTAISDLDLEFLQMFANQSAAAIENSRLYRELERRLIDLRKAHQKERENQETLMRMERLSVMGETSAVVAHELRNPLVAIGGFARALVRAMPQDDPNRRYAAIITEEVARMERIIHDLLDFIRPLKQTRETVVVDGLVRETVGRFLKRLEEKSITLDWDLEAGQAAVRCHPGEVQQVLENYLVNAMQAAGDGGFVTVATRALEGGVRVSVADNGPGFAPDLADKLFSPFFSTKPTGSGLGLTICAQIVKAHGGVIEAANRPGGGAEFGFILPLPRDEEEAGPGAGVTTGNGL